MIRLNNFRKFASVTPESYTYEDLLRDLQTYEGWGTHNNDKIYMDTADLKDKHVPTMPGGVKLYPFVEQYLRKNLKYTGDLKVGSRIPRKISKQLQEWYLQNHVGVRTMQGFDKLPVNVQNHLLQLGFNANLPNWKNFRGALAAGNKAEMVKHLRDSNVWRKEQERLQKGEKFTPRWTNTINAIEKEFGLTPPTVTVADITKDPDKQYIQNEHPVVTKLPERPITSKNINLNNFLRQSKETNKRIHPKTGETWAPEKLMNATKSTPIIEL